MPTYTYHCKECNRGFEKTMSISEHERRPRLTCPKCKSRKVQQEPAAVHVVTGKKN